MRAYIGVPLWLFSAGLALSACAAWSRHNDLTRQQDVLMTSLHAEIGRGQITIEAIEGGIRVRMSNDLLYIPGSAELDPKGRAALDKVAQQLALMTAHDYEIEVVGHTDNKPIGWKLAERYPTNWELAGARAAAVVRYLQEHGIDPMKLEAISRGQYHPLATNENVAGRARNRRTDLVLRPR